MPKSKPSALNVRHDTLAARDARTAAESAMRPVTDLSSHVPPELFGEEHEVAKRTWRRVVGLFAETDGELVTAFDRDSLIEYCLLVEEIAEMMDMRRIMRADWEEQRKKTVAFQIGEDGDAGELIKLWEITNALYQKFQGLDARLDGKRKHLHTKQQSLYLTPRSRAGVAPPTKEQQLELSAMDELLGG